jgi:NTP pyrophosphatase (non-canonical NTP hydrolase)
LFKDYSLETIRKNKEILERLSDEIADVFIYLISLTNSINVDLTDIFIKKMEKNRNKYSTNEFNNGSYRKL